MSSKNIQDRHKIGELVKKAGYLEDGKRGQQIRAQILLTDLGVANR